MQPFQQPGSTGRYHGLHQHPPLLSTVLTSPPGAICKGMGGMGGPGAWAQLAVLHLAPLQSWAGHGQEGNRWLKPGWRWVSWEDILGSSGSGGNGEDSQALGDKMLLIKSLWLLTSLAGSCHGWASAKATGTGW